VNKSDARFQAARIPKFDNPLGVAEGDILSTVGWLHLVAAEDDGDYHIQISRTHDNDHGTDFLILEVPTPAPEFVADASVRPRLEAVRSLIRERMLRSREPSRSGSVLTHPACVEVAGQLFYDDPHVGHEPRGKKGMKAATLWGITSYDAHRLQSRLHAVATTNSRRAGGVLHRSLPFGRVFRPSFSSIASTTNSMTAMSCVTQCSLSRR